MMAFEKALEIVLEHTKMLAPRTYALGEVAQNTSPFPYVLAEDVITSCDIPAFANSAMDGFAIRFQDVRQASPERPVSLKIVGEIPAGARATKPLSSGQAYRIMTGAPLPHGADTVVSVEETRQDSKEGVWILSAGKPGKHVRLAGEDLRNGERVFQKGDLLHPPGIGVLAAIKSATVTVVPKPRVGFFVTGNELLPVDRASECRPEQIVDSNSPMLLSYLRELSCEANFLGIVTDEESRILETLRSAFTNSDCVLTCGGISMGEYDLVQKMFRRLGGEVLFWKVAVKPGKPLLFGHYQGTPFFALPGNPVSTAVLWEEFVRPALLKMMGYRALFRPVIAALCEEEIRENEKLTCFIRVKAWEEAGVWRCKPQGLQGSHVLSGMAQATGLLRVAQGRGRIPLREIVPIRLLSSVHLTAENWPNEF